MAKKSFKIRANLAEALVDTITSAKNNSGELCIEIIPLRKISLDPENPRDLKLTFEDCYQGISKDDEQKNIEKKALASMIKSIVEQGVLNPVIVYKYGEQYRLIAGERRALASILAKKEDIPARVLTAKPDSLKLSLLQWIENIEREDLTLWERLRNLEKILLAFAEIQQKSAKEITPTDLSQLLGCSLQQGVNYRHVLNASPDLREQIQNGKIKNIEKAAFVAKSSQVAQDALLQACCDDATLSELKKLAHELTQTQKVKEKGRPTPKINFGSTKNHKVAKAILRSVLNHKDFQHLKQKLGEVVWNDHKSVGAAFRQLVKLLEQV